MRDISSDASMDFYLVQFWRDSRIYPVKTQIKVTGRVLPNDVWYPDTYFLLVRDLIYSDEEQYIVVNGNGNVEYNRKVKLSTPCSPNVMLFPFDVVRCSLVLTSFGYTSDEINYLWLEDENRGCYIDRKNNNVDHLGFYLMGVEMKSGKIQYGGSNYSSLETIIYLKRKYSAYVMQVYFPAALIVILSWTIFWINLHATPARASLGVTTVLTMLTLATQSTAHNEKHVNNKVTAIDIYLWVCFVFVIFAMIEFALSDFKTHRYLDEMATFTLRSSSESEDEKCILLVNKNAHHKLCGLSAAGGGASFEVPCKHHAAIAKTKPNNISFSTTHHNKDKHDSIDFAKKPSCTFKCSRNSAVHLKKRPMGGAATITSADHRVHFVEVKRQRPHHKTPNSTLRKINNNNNNLYCYSIPKKSSQHLKCNGFHEAPNPSILSSDKEEILCSDEFTLSTMLPNTEDENEGGTARCDSEDSCDEGAPCSMNSGTIFSSLVPIPNEPPGWDKKNIQSLNVINNMARVLFPVCFLAFNVCYWTALLLMISTNESYKLSSFFTSLRDDDES